MHELFGALEFLVGTGVIATSIGAAKSFIDRTPALKELGWQGALIWPAIFLFSFVAKAAQAGYKLGESVPYDGAGFLPFGPPPEAQNALTGGTESDDSK